MSKVIQYKGGYGTGASYDIPGYEYDAVNDQFTDLETGKVFDKDGKAGSETNKAVTIDVSTYTSPVEVTPSAGKDSMRKVTVSLENIPEIPVYPDWLVKGNELNSILPNGNYCLLFRSSADSKTVQGDGTTTLGELAGLDWCNTFDSLLYSAFNGTDTVCHVSFSL